MRFRGSVAIDLGTVNTLAWVAGRGIVLEEPTAIAIDTGVGKVAAVGEAADALADKEPQDIEVIHPLRDGVIADLDATAAMLHAFLRRTRRFSLIRRDALVCVPSGATPVERRSIIGALSVRRARYHVRLIDEPVAGRARARGGPVTRTSGPTSRWPPRPAPGSTGPAGRAASWSTSAAAPPRSRRWQAGGWSGPSRCARPATPWTRPSCRRCGTSSA